MMPKDIDEAIDSLTEAFYSGKISLERLYRSRERRQEQIDEEEADAAAEEHADAGEGGGGHQGGPRARATLAAATVAYADGAYAVRRAEEGRGGVFKKEKGMALFGYERHVSGGTNLRRS